MRKIECPKCKHIIDIGNAYEWKMFKCPICDTEYSGAVSVGNENSIQVGIIINDEEKKHCPVCGEEILAVAKKCKHCGEYLDENEEAAKKKTDIVFVSPQKKIDYHVYVLLAILFGEVGVHNFYAGKLVSGTIKVLISFIAIGCFADGHQNAPIGAALLIGNFIWIISEICNNPNENAHSSVASRKESLKSILRFALFMIGFFAAFFAFLFLLRLFLK